MSLHTTVKTKKAKICLFSWKNKESNTDAGEELYLSQIDPEVEDGDEPDHLVIQKITKETGEVEYHINGKEVEPRIIEELIRFLMD